MSTTFGVKIEGGTIEVARRSNGIRWTNELAKFLPKDTPVIPLDNTYQGIETIGDISLKIFLEGDFNNQLKESFNLNTIIFLESKRGTGQIDSLKRIFNEKSNLVVSCTILDNDNFSMGSDLSYLIDELSNKEVIIFDDFSRCSNTIKKEILYSISEFENKTIIFLGDVDEVRKGYLSEKSIREKMTFLKDGDIII